MSSASPMGHGSLLPIISNAPLPMRWRARRTVRRSEEHTSELQSLMRISYAVFCLKKKIHKVNDVHNHHTDSRNTDQESRHTPDTQLLTQSQRPTSQPGA